MPWKTNTELWDIVGALVISTLSGIISITRRIAKGQPATIFWVISEFLTAIMCGYLMYDAYPHVQANFPEWFTLPLAVAFAAHAGGRLFQEAENAFISHYTKLCGKPRP